MQLPLRKVALRSAKIAGCKHPFRRATADPGGPTDNDANSSAQSTAIS